MSNLLSNAILHTPQRGRVVVSVNTEREGVTISVDNDGKEIAPQFLPFIFERLSIQHYCIGIDWRALGLQLLKLA